MAWIPERARAAPPMPYRVRSAGRAALFFKANIYSVSRQSGYSEEQVFTNHNRERSRVLGRGRRRDLEGGGGA
jgi:hypothetical protein